VQGMITGLVVITPAAGIIKKDVIINSPQHFPILDARFSCRPLDGLLIVCWFKVFTSSASCCHLGRISKSHLFAIWWCD
jgi:hypothetical protein